MTEAEISETKRERVRRLFIRPLEYAGFRARRETDPRDHQKLLDRLADSLSYLTDQGLKVLAASMETKGEGTSKCFWPAYATIIGWAEAFQPRPLEEMPELLRWFASAAGREALAQGRLIAEYDFFKRKKRPPLGHQERLLIAEKSDELQRRADRIAEARAKGFGAQLPDDDDFMAWYEERIGYLAGLVEGLGRAEDEGIGE